ncbi:ABC transporter substrate-binding protein [Algihabitans albus]|uniref:ABC transporter substrate-binding protein n=1 Tax=Algihabitans albus TaxID=2164067 RepID=UPI000E5CE9ED|nr:ABC transporter substrate-binding protein [Algihabitans albus]
MKRVLATAAISALTLGVLTLGGDAVKAGPDDNSLTIGLGEEFPNLNGYLNTARDGVVMTRHLFDTLIWRNPETFEYEPLLATSWRQIDERSWEFDLRDGVTFHDGSEFSAEDVTFTLNRYADPEAGARSQASVGWIERVEAVDARTVRIVSKEPFPAALEFIAGSLPIYPSDAYQAAGPDAFGQSPIGTGPYALTAVEGGTYTLTRNPAYFADGGKGTPSIEVLRVRTIPDSATRIAELIGGGIDWTWNMPSDQIEQLSDIPGVTAVLGSTMRIAMVALDAAGRTSEGNPLTDVRVRQAINHAIDRETIVTNLVGGDGRTINAPCYPRQFGCDESAAVVYDYDPEKAKALLAEAGFSEGFTVEMASYRDRARAEAVQAYLAVIGITANLEMLQARASFSAWREGQIGMWYGDWGSFSIADASASMGNFFNGGTNDGARDEEIMALIAEANVSVDPETRKQSYAEAITLASERAYWVPMHTIVMGYAYKSDLDFTPHVDELPRFFSASWK